MNLVSGADLQDAWVDQCTPGGQRLTHYTCSRTGRHLATFTRRPGSRLYTLTTASPPITVSGQVAASGQVFAAASRSCMASRTLVSGLPRSLPPLPPGPAPTCVPCVEGRQRAAPHSSEFPPTEAPLQTLHMDVWGPARVRGQGHERYFLLVVDDYSRYTTVFPLRRNGEVAEVLIDWIRGARCQLSESFGSDLPVLRLHSDRGGEFSSDLLRAFCRAEGIHQTFTLLASPQRNGIAERRIGMVMDVARISMIHAAAPHFLWPFVVQYAVHQINLQPRVSLPETTPTLRWTGKVGDATVFRVWGSQAFVRDTSAVKLSSRAGPAPSGVSQVDPVEPVEVAVDSGAARGAEPAGAGPGGAEPGVAVSEGAELGVAEPERVEPGGAEPGGAESGGAEPGRAAGATGPAAGGASRVGAAGAGAAGAAKPGGAGAGGTGAVGGPPSVGTAGGAGAAGPGGARTGGTGAVGSGGAAGVGAVGAGAVATGGAAGAGTAGGTGAGGAAGVVAGDPGAEGTGAVSAVSGGAARPRPYYVPLLQQSRPASPESRPESLVCAVRTGRRVPHQRPPLVPGTHYMTLRTSTSPQRVPLPSPPASSLHDGPDPESDSLRAASPTDTRFLATVVTDPSFESTATSALVAELVDFAAACRLDYADSLVAEFESASICPPSVGGECALGTDVLEDRQEEFECFAAALPHLVSMLLAPEGDLDAPDILTPRSYAEAIEGPYSSKWQTAMDTKMASWKSWTRTQCSLRRPVYGLRQAPRKWNDTLRTTLAALGFTPSTADPSLFLRTNTSMLPFYVLVYLDDLVLLRFGFQFSSPQPTPLSNGHSLSAPPSDESVEPSGPYPELMGCLMYLMTCTRPDLGTSGMGLVLGGRGLVVLTGHADASWVDDSATQWSSQGYTFSLGSGSISWRSTRSSSVLSSSCEAEIYAGAMAAQELRWLTYLLTDLGEQPRSPPVLYVDDKAMIALC
ncbi:unnamed protein product [Closterium sp. NIES-54]